MKKQAYLDIKPKFRADPVHYVAGAITSERHGLWSTATQQWRWAAQCARHTGSQDYYIQRASEAAAAAARA